MPRPSWGRAGRSSPRSTTSSTAATRRPGRWPRTPSSAAAFRPTRTTGTARPSSPRARRAPPGLACATFSEANNMRLPPRFHTVRQAGLHTRVGLVLTGLAACLLLVLGSLWLHATRNSVHEEVEAATRVSEQWLKVVLGELRT